MSNELLDEVFSNTSKSVDFEITFAAFLATGLMANPNVSPPLTTITYTVAMALLFTTLVRRMAVINEFALSEKIIRNTTPILVILSTYSGLYFALALGTYTAVWIPLSPLYLALIFLFVFILTSIVPYEFYFRDFMLLMAVYMYEKYEGSVEKSKFGDRVIEFIRNTLDASILDEEDYPPEADRIRDPKSASEDVGRWERVGADIGVKLAVGTFVLLFITSGVLFVSLVPYSSIVEEAALFLLGLFSFLAINYLMIFIQFVYGRYGTMKFKQMASVWYTLLLSTFLYLIITIHLSYVHNLNISPI